MLGAGIVFCAYLYGPEAGIGLGIICTIPIVRIIRGWAHLESFDHKSFSIARELESRHTEPTVAAPHDGARPARVQRGQTVVGQSKLLDAMSERKRPNGKARAGTLLQGATSYRSRVISPVEAPEARSEAATEAAASSSSQGTADDLGAPSAPDGSGSAHLSPSPPAPS